MHCRYCEGDYVCMFVLMCSVSVCVCVCDVAEFKIPVSKVQGGQPLPVQLRPAVHQQEEEPLQGHLAL